MNDVYYDINGEEIVPPTYVKDYCTGDGDYMVHYIKDYKDLDKLYTDAWGMLEIVKDKDDS
jgi:hypothetical protein